jgi:hypothetical protein
MAEQSSHGSSGGSLLLTAMAGAVLGAAGLAWWLVSEADRRRQAQARSGVEKRPSPQVAGAEDAPARPQPNLDLHDKVHALNQAIEDVRRQLEAMEAGH